MVGGGVDTSAIGVGVIGVFGRSDGIPTFLPTFLGLRGAGGGRHLPFLYGVSRGWLPLPLLFAGWL